MVDSKYYVEYDEIDQVWDVKQMDAGSEHKQLYDVTVCACRLKVEALCIRDALDSFPYTVEDYIVGIK